jgi:hypothetical protein
VTTSDGHGRWSVAIRTNGGNQSWTGLSKRFDPTKADGLFVLVGDGRPWFLPAAAVESTSGLRLGGMKHSEFEIDPAGEILPLVYGSGANRPTIERPARGSAGVGEPGRTVNPVPKLLSGFESHLPHSRSAAATGARELGRPGQAVIRRKRQMTLPLVPFTEAGFAIGDRLRFRADGLGRVIIDGI